MREWASNVSLCDSGVEAGPTQADLSSYPRVHTSLL